MGQYYHPIVLEPKKENELDVIMHYMVSHDYSNGLKLMEHSWVNNKFVRAFESLIADNPQRVVWAGDYAEKELENDRNLYDISIDRGKVKPAIPETEFRFVINHTLKRFVDKNNSIGCDDGYKIHPLPLLTCEGNGQGGGDFFGADPRGLIGSWARDVISVSNEKPNDEYEELIFDLVE